jgi:type I restriction enzyme M protein
MLDNETKRRIDTARDILVGKVPDPKSQVEQITIALIYKFMDDMDMESVEFGGEVVFFTGEYEKYKWTKLIAKNLSGVERLNLYGEALTQMPHNAKLPQLFRDIFKNAYLPYRDPETLNLFLKSIDEFQYDHSERLGDAFEYLLSVLGSQGSAGQFRTPRHIIDFIVQVVDPQKHETILDPACGTAGFLISSYKHILSQHTKQRPGDLLTPGERKQLVENFTGYDISPDMVRLSLVNLYLHQFPNPHVWEYDTLTSEDRWNESYDVILANPPFMSPKGGIQPHKRFSIQSTRSEVLFVDYIAEHLTPQGRAGIIVPEGIIFQSGTAYKSLRKMLVDKYLWAVVSLPAGVFQPYSGVKTSILLLDRQLARRTDKLLFVKLGADGFDLGAQRRSTEANDLPATLEALHGFKKAVMDGKGWESGSDLCLVVEKEKVGESGDYNLSGERYQTLKNISSDWEIVELRDIFKLSSGNALIQSDMKEGIFPVYGGNGKTGFHDEYFIEKPTIVIGRVGAYCGSIHITEPKSWVTDNGLFVTNYLTEVNQDFLAHILTQLNLNQFAKVGGQPSISQATIYEQKIPLPPLEEQRRIVEEIGGYERIIAGARQVVESYQPRIEVDGDWEMVELGEVCKIQSGGTPDRNMPDYWNGTIPWVKTGQINFQPILKAEEFITEEGLNNSSTRLFPKGTILMAMYGQGVTRGKVAMLEIEATINQACAAISIQDQRIQKEFLYLFLSTKYEDLRKMSEARGGNQSNLNAQMIKQLKIPLPDLPTQSRLVAAIERERALVAGCRELVGLYEGKVRERIGRVWG